jgi:MFS family permease
MLAAVLIAGGLVVATTPLWKVDSVRWVLMTFMAFQLSSYAVSDAAILERVPGAVRGRVVGRFLTIAGTFSAISPWVMGFWTDRLRERAHEPLAYLPLFATLGLMMVGAVACAPLIARLGEVQGPPIEPITETTPATAEPVL